MNLVGWLEKIMVGFGAAWVMWLLIFLSVISITIILERLYFFHTLKDDLTKLSEELRVALDQSIGAAKKKMSASPSAEAAVVMAGLEFASRGADAAESAMEGAKAIQRMKLEKNLTYLGTLGNNAPFVGLLGTVIGIIGGFKALGSAEAMKGGAQMAPQQVMGSIAEALVATAVGIAVAIPAVAAFNTFQRRIKSIMASTEGLSRVLLAHLRSEPESVSKETAAKDAPKADADGKDAPKQSERVLRSTVKEGLRPAEEGNQAKKEASKKDGD